jgi:hypothetical protein
MFNALLAVEARLMPERQNHQANRFDRVYRFGRRQVLSQGT